MILVWLLEANYTLNILVFLYWWQIILGSFPFFFTGGQVGDTSHCTTIWHLFSVHQIFQIILYTIFFIICVERLLRIGSHFSVRKWRRWPHFPTKLAAMASFFYKIGGGGLIFLQNWRQGFDNITGGCSDMVWILGSILLKMAYSYGQRKKNKKTTKKQ